ncbi:MAG: glutamine--fructose-6-phosphate transaminase (isomerizing), partial [Verrucomicrobiae bacterium]|nr:glutamine--fructose-6-phosphate transaminase (isomerizing) [Verrucomicrobiae bacterium]
EKLEKAGHSFQSETDTEVLAHWIGVKYEKLAGSPRNGKLPILIAVEEALRDVVGTYGIAVLCADFPSVIVGARRGSPLVVGIGKGENFLASDVSAIVSQTRDVIYLKDHDLVVLQPDRFEIFSMINGTADYQVSRVEWSAEAAEKGDFPHFMLKEIFEQPQTIQNACRGRISHEEWTAVFGGLNLTAGQLRAIDRIILTACGTSWHAALVGEYFFEEIAGIPATVEYASEFRYRNTPIEKNTLVFAITQSGETADTLAALRESKRKGHPTLAICNVVGSTIAREADGGVYLRAGPEIGVASTKAFTSQVTALLLLALYMGRTRRLSGTDGKQLVSELDLIPGKIESILAQSDRIKQIALKYKSCVDFLFLGRLGNFPVALEGALKLKEISYVHAEGYPAAEMKHGPIALIDDKTPSVFVCPRDQIYDKVMSNLEEVKARKGPVIAIATEGDADIAKKADDVIYIPPTLEHLQPLLTIIPLQLLAYHFAVALGCDVDKPRNLAKSVTVE